MSDSPGLLEHAFGHVFADPALLQQALTHRSAGSRNNERLEFLGDAVLGCAITDELYRRYPHAKEGELSRLRATLVRRESLAEIAHGLEIGKYLTLGAGERRSGGHHRDSILSDAVEAVLGAIYLDSDFAVCKQCILALFLEKLDSLSDVAVLKDAKTRLQEYLQSRHQPLPEYIITKVSGEAHSQLFQVECVLNDSKITPSLGQGNSRRQAEQDAAGKMLKVLEAG